ncbi:MAG: serine--tRNA ligase [Defluviitaleaceae bacterium]|nr:serine--tRNA ligase [Defluviitaleaceae bacterium]MCL2836811.1 serine--tRNA ligase [Defluviitaleaceae bacterium]
MLDIVFIRENAEIVKKACIDKKMPADIDRLLEVDAALKAATTVVDEIRARRNTLSKSKDKSAEMIDEARNIKTVLAAEEEKQKALRAEFDGLMLHVPSIPAEGVPIGAGEEDNAELRRVGAPKVMDFEPKDHMELMEALDMVDVPRGVKVAGSRSYFLKNKAVILEMAVTRMVMDMLSARGFAPMAVPQIVRYEAMQGTGYFPIGYEQAYKITEDELFLIGTSEVPLVCFHQDEILTKDEMPVRFAGMSTCFRREAGTYGKDTRGLYRVHQFQKVEQVVFCEADQGKALELHNEILQNAEDILQALELPYRVCAACTAELGIGQIRKHEVETWMPSRNAYCETHSCSTLGDFQARRANIRYRDESGKLRFVFTLNNTAIASPRILIPLIENHQNADGSIYIPVALRPYLGGVDKIS